MMYPCIVIVMGVMDAHYLFSYGLRPAAIIGKPSQLCMERILYVGSVTNCNFVTVLIIGPVYCESHAH